MEPIDRQQFATLVDELPRPIFLQIVQSFARETDNYLHRMQLGLGSADLETVARAAHDMRGFASNFGAVMVGETTNRIERACSAHDIETAAGLVGQIKHECANAWAAISKALAALS